MSSKPISHYQFVSAMFFLPMGIFVTRKIKKLGKFFLVNAISMLCSVWIQIVMPFPWGIMAGYSIGICLMIYFINRWEAEYRTNYVTDVFDRAFETYHKGKHLKDK